MNNLAAVWLEQGKLVDAEALVRDTLERCERVLDEGHPLTNTVRAHLQKFNDGSGAVSAGEAVADR